MSRQASRPLQPVDPQELYNVLAGAASQDPVLVKASADRLKQMTEMLGTYDGLSHFAAQRDIPLIVRQQSIIQFKNEGISRWRSRKYVSRLQRTLNTMFNDFRPESCPKNRKQL